MSNNILERLAQMSTPDIKRANWNLDYDVAGTNDFGFLKVKMCELINANSKVKLDFKSAYCTNPTISPVFSKAKVRVSAFWIPISLYVPALRDGSVVKAGQTDYTFPAVNLPYSSDAQLVKGSLSSSTALSWDSTPMQAIGNEAHLKAVLTSRFGQYTHYVPMGSLLSELGMWKPDYRAVGFTLDDLNIEYPPAKCAIPLLGYFDIYRTYIANSQEEYIPLRVQSFKPAFDYEYTVPDAVEPDVDGWSTRIGHVSAQPAKDVYITREKIELLLRDVRSAFMQNLYDSGLINVSFNRHFGASLFPTLTPINFELYLNQDSLETVKSFMTRNPPITISENHYYELRDTYMGDRFTAYLSNENVEYERSTARVQTDENGYITMEQVYAAQRVQNYIRRSVFKNNGYADFVEAEAGITPPTTLTHPMFLGSVSTDLFWNDVVSQTQTLGSNDIESNTNLGSRASIGFGRMLTGSYRGKDDRPFVSFTAKEPGYLMLIESIVPDISYFMQYNPDFDKITLESLYWPAFDKDGYQDKQFSHVVQQFDEDLGVMPLRIDFDSYNVAYAKEPAYSEHMMRANRMTGQIVEAGVYRHWVFSRQGYADELREAYDNNQSPSFENLVRKATTTYVDPEPYNKIFANENGLDNFQTYYSFDFKVYQPLSHRFLSFSQL